MDEYINRDALLAESADIDNWWKPYAYTIEHIKSFPASDVAPVVRCRDCKHYLEFRTKKNKQIMRFCYRMGKHDMEYPVKPDDFCSYGKRKDGAENG